MTRTSIAKVGERPISTKQGVDVVSYSDWLNDTKWTFFCTFTTPYEMTYKSGRRLMDRYFDRVQKMTDYQARLFWAVDPNELRDGCHLHGLMQVPDVFKMPVNYQGLLNAYRTVVSKDHIGRIQLRKFDNRKNAGGYCTKYIIKSQKGEADYDFYL